MQCVSFKFRGMNLLQNVGSTKGETDHMMLAPARTNLIAPRSTPTRGSISGTAVVGSGDQQIVAISVCPCLELTAVEDLEGRVEGAVEMLEKDGFAVHGIDRDVIPAVVARLAISSRPSESYAPSGRRRTT